MKYLEDAIKFLGRYYILALPLFLLAFIPALIGGQGSGEALDKIRELYSKLNNPVSQFQNPGEILGLFKSSFALIAGSGILAFILNFIAIPSTYGLINKALETGKAGLNDFTRSLGQNFLKYVFYWLGNIVVWTAFGVAAVLIFLILAALTVVLDWLGVLLIVLAAIAFILAAIVLTVFLSLWYPVMVVDDLDVFAAIRKSILIARPAFWTILGIGILVSIAGAILGGILSFLGEIPFFGVLVLSAIPAATGFVMTTFYLLIYRDKTGKSLMGI